MTYVDENGQSVYGQRIKALGESERATGAERAQLTDSQLGVTRSLIRPPRSIATGTRLVPCQFAATHLEPLRRGRPRRDPPVLPLLRPNPLRDPRANHRAPHFVIASRPATRQSQLPGQGIRRRHAPNGRLPAAQIRQVRLWQMWRNTGTILPGHDQGAQDQLLFELRGTWTFHCQLGADGLPKLPENDLARVSGVRSGRSSAPTPRGHPAVGLDRCGQAGRGSRECRPAPGKLPANVLRKSPVSTETTSTPR